MTLLSGNAISKVWRSHDGVHKQQPSFLTTNEIWCLERLYPYGIVPRAEQVGVEEIVMDYIPRASHLFDWGYLQDCAKRILAVLEGAGIRHGDLTKYAVIMHESTGDPYLIDFAESRLMCDPRPDKRPEGDSHWLYKTMREYAS